MRKKRRGEKGEERRGDGTNICGTESEYGSNGANRKARKRTKRRDKQTKDKKKAKKA